MLSAIPTGVESGRRVDAIANCRLVSVEDGVVQADRVIVLEGPRIQRIVSATDWSPPPGAAVIDARGSYASPGLIDMHVHACYDSDRDAAVVGRPSESPGIMAIRAAANLRCALAAGITTVRDLGAGHGASLDVKRAWTRQLFRGSRPFVAGPMLTAIGGHGTEGGSSTGLEVCGPDDMRRVVRTLIAKGVDAIKVVTCGGAVRPELRLDELMAAVEEAHWCGVPVASHAHFEPRSIMNSVLAGCDTIEHGCALTDEAMDAMAERGTALCPTITVFARILEEPERFGGPTSRFVGKVRAAWERHLENVGEAHRRGIPIIAGTDAGVTGVGFDALAEELGWIAHCGIPAIDVLRAATSRAAACLRREDLGSLRPGCTADVILTAADPLCDTAALRQMELVVQSGVAFAAYPFS